MAPGAATTSVATTFISPSPAPPATKPFVNKPTPGHVTLTADGATWYLADKNNTYSAPTIDLPVAANGSEGTLSISYPAFHNGATEGIGDWPLSDYQVVYQPKDSQLPQQILKTFPALAQPSQTSSCEPCQLYNYVIMVAAVADNHYLVEVHVFPPNAQNGGDLQLWWFEPATSSVKLLLTGPEIGGGKFSTEVHNSSWLFFNQSQVAINPKPDDYAIEDAHSYLINMRTGKKLEVNLGDNNSAIKAEWKSDGRLYYSVRNFENKIVNKIIDPATGIIIEG